MTRVTVTVDDEIFDLVCKNPEALELDPKASQSSRLSQILREGFVARRTLLRDQERRNAYVAHAADPAHGESVTEVFDLAEKSGLV